MGVKKSQASFDLEGEKDHFELLCMCLTFNFYVLTNILIGYCCMQTIAFAFIQLCLVLLTFKLVILGQ